MCVLLNDLIFVCYDLFWIYGSRKIFFVDNIYGGEVRPRKIGKSQNNVPSIIQIMLLVSLNITNFTFIFGIGIFENQTSLVKNIFFIFREKHNLY